MQWPWIRRSAASRAAADWEKSSQRLLNLLKRHEKRLKSLESELRGMMDRVDYDLAQAEKLEQMHSEALEALRTENKILAEVTVPTLVAQNELILKRVEADTSLQIQRQLAMGGRRED